MVFGEIIISASNMKNLYRIIKQHVRKLLGFSGNPYLSIESI